MIAAEIRQAILQEVGLTCCAGIAHNKLLAKLVGAWKKPNMQTTLLPKDAESFLSGLKARDIPGIYVFIFLYNLPVKVQLRIYNTMVQDLTIKLARKLINLGFLMTYKLHTG